MVFAGDDYEKELWEKGLSLVCGIDEVGRGCFAGPVVAGAVIFPSSIVLPEGIADSKLLKPKQREDLSKRIQEVALAWAIGEVSVEMINQVGIAKATQLAYLEAIKNLTTAPEHFLIDAFYIAELGREKQTPIINGDKLSVSIAAASIVAKVYRDELMTKLHQECPEYGFDKHKGYGTKAHRDAIKIYKLSPHHRTSFNLEKFL